MPKLLTASHKQRKFVRSYLEHGSRVKAAEEAYGTKNKNTSRSLADATLKQPATIAYMKRIMDKAGMTDDNIANGLKLITEAGLSANSLKQAKPADALKAIEMTSKLKDLFPAEKKKIQKTEVTYNFSEKSDEELLSLIDEKTEELKRFSKLLKSDTIGKIVDAEVV